MCFIEDNDAAGDVVELAAGGGAAGEERLKELNVGGNDKGGVPVFSGEAGPGGYSFRIVRIEVTMMFKYGVSAESLAEDISVLLDNGGVGDDVDDALQVVVEGMGEGERERGEGFAAARGDGEGEEAGRMGGSFSAAGLDVGTELVEWGRGCETG